MSRYEYFDYGQEEEEGQEAEQWGESQPVSVKGMIPKANPLMHRVQFTPYDPLSYYPTPAVRLPDALSHHHYHTDRNNMTLIDQTVFTHQQLRQDVANCLHPHRQLENNPDLVTLGEYYSSRSLVYQKFRNGQKSSYFATYVLSLAQMGQAQIPLTSNMTTERKQPSGRSCVQFSSDFESGNLFRAYQREAWEFDLVLQNDINTRGNNQWFFFSVRNIPRGQTLRFNIVNLTKKHSLFSQGMRPSVFSMVRFERRGIGWVRQGSKVAYHASEHLRRESSNQPYYTLSFEYKFTHEGDVVYFSYSIPYTFSTLNSFLTNKLALHSARVKVKSLGRTVGGNEVNLFQVSSPEIGGHHKKSVWIMARQHPGETTASFMLEGVFDFLLSDSPAARQLLENFVFKIVPMVNIDGVVHGNTRAQLVGCDSNRQWADPHRHHHPILHAIKHLIAKDNVEMLLDLHSHSRRLGTFFYANAAPPGSLARVFPLLVAKKDPRFDWKGNRFGGGSSLTARKVLGDLLKTPLVYTVESSFFGYQKEGDFKIIPYQPQDYREIAVSILSAFAEAFHSKEQPLQDHRILLGPPQDQDGLWKKASSNEDDLESVGSDEDAGADEFSKKEMQMVIPKRKTTKHKKRRLSVKIPQVRPRKESKQEQAQVRPKKIDPEPCFKRMVATRCSLSLKRTELRFARRACVETKSAAVQVQMGERGVLGRSSAGNVPAKGLCIWGQKMEEEIVVSGCSVGLQVEMARAFLRSRNDMALSTENLSRRAPKKTARIGTIMLHNENNFLNRADILHSALRMLNRR